MAETSDRFVWNDGDVVVVNPEDDGVEVLIAKIEAAAGDSDMIGEVTAEANAYLARSQSVLLSNKVRTALEKLISGANKE